MFLKNLFQFAVLALGLLVSLSNWLDVIYINLQFSHNSSHVYDFIIVGGGSSGSVIAGRLAESGYEVLLLEAGGPPPWLFTLGLIDAPIFGPLWQRTTVDWSYVTEPQRYSCGALEQRASKWPRGRMLGGSSRLNNMVYLRGHQNDWKDWGISFSEMLHYFKKSEKQLGKYSNHSQFHSKSGWMPVADMRHTTELSTAVLQAAKEIGYNIEDLNTMLSTGFMEIQTTSNNGVRFTADQAFLYTSKAANLYIKTNALVGQILFGSDLEAEGVQFYVAGNMYKAHSRHGVILSAGAVGSPKILLQSGIGPPEHLSHLQIPVQVPLPSVGQNLQDHVSTGGGLVLLNSTLSLSLLNLANPSSFWQYASGGTGPLTHGGCEVSGLLYINESSAPPGPPDIQILVLPAGPTFDLGVHLRHNMGISSLVWDKYFSGSNDVGVTLLVVLLHPHSRGYIKLHSKDPFQPPIINPNYLADPRDVETLVDGIYKVKKLLNTVAMSKIGAHLNTKHLPGCENYEFDTRDYWRCYTKMLSFTVYHPAGTCRMGSPNDQTTVVDRSFRVLGTKKLFVADASVMPSLPSANINAAVTALAEKAADCILDTLRNGLLKTYRESFMNILSSHDKKTQNLTCDILQ